MASPIFFVLDQKSFVWDNFSFVLDKNNLVQTDGQGNSFVDVEIVDITKIYRNVIVVVVGIELLLSCY